MTDASPYVRTTQHAWSNLPSAEQTLLFPRMSDAAALFTSVGNGAIDLDELTCSVAFSKRIGEDNALRSSYNGAAGCETQCAARSNFGRFVFLHRS